MIRYYNLLSLSLLIFISCDTPFSTKPSSDEDLFVINHDYDQSPIFHKTAVQVSWSNITIEDFKEFRIEKAKIVNAIIKSIFFIFNLIFCFTYY